MMNKKEEKKYDAVEMMREIRNKLSEEYYRHPEKEEKDLIEIRQKYGIKNKIKVES